MASKDYRFSREDFGLLPLAPLHYDLFFDVRATRVRVVSRQTYIRNADAARLELNAHGLQVARVQVFQTHAALGPPPVGIDAGTLGTSTAAHCSTLQH